MISSTDFTFQSRNQSFGQAQQLWKQKGQQTSILLLSMVAFLSAVVGGAILGVALVEARQNLCVERASKSILCKIMTEPMEMEQADDYYYEEQDMFEPMAAPHAIEAAMPAQESLPTEHASTNMVLRSESPLGLGLHPRYRLKPILMEVAVITFVHAVGLNLLKKTGSQLTKLPWMSLYKKARALYKSGYYLIKKVYKKTHASKICTRVKKQVKHALHHSHGHDHHHDDHHSGSSSHH